MSEQPENIETVPHPPEGIAPPMAIDDADDVLELWSGPATLVIADKTYSGAARVFVDFLPQPKLAFELKAENKTAGARGLAQGLAGLGIPLGSGELSAGEPLGQLSVTVYRFNGITLSGVVEPNARRPDVVTAAKLLVVNGPCVRGDPIMRGEGGIAGRLQVTINNATLTVDRLSIDEPSRRCSFAFTHIAEIRFDKPRPATELEPIQSTLFRALSLMRGRWVGLVGPWHYSGEQLAFLSPELMKTSRNGNNYSWYPDSEIGVFEELVVCLHTAYSDPKRAEAIQTGFHWLIESSLCAGAIEGSLILQQAALESLAWYEVVQCRSLCSTSGFDKLPASDKIRWLLSLYSIPADIPVHRSEIVAYASEFGLTDMLDVLADVRNALIHGTPKKVERLLGRRRGDHERTQLWHQVGGILDQAVLAAIGYQGMIARRDLDVEWKISAIERVPWANK